MAFKTRSELRLKELVSQLDAPGRRSWRRSRLSPAVNSAPVKSRDDWAKLGIFALYSFLSDRWLGFLLGRIILIKRFLDGPVAQVDRAAAF
jgi:hypothetical protein